MVGQYLLSRINAIRVLWKVGAGLFELALAAVSIHETLESGVTMHQARASRNEITFNLRIEPDVGAVRADEAGHFVGCNRKTEAIDGSDATKTNRHVVKL